MKISSERIAYVRLRNGGILDLNRASCLDQPGLRFFEIVREELQHRPEWLRLLNEKANASGLQACDGRLAQKDAHAAFLLVKIAASSIRSVWINTSLNATLRSEIAFSFRY